MKLPDFIYEIVDFLKGQHQLQNIDAAIILGSGLGGFSQQIENSNVIPYADIPAMPQTSVEGHAGKLMLGNIGKKTVMAFAGRFHYYEGVSFAKTVVPVQIAYGLQADKLLISNAAGAINTSFSVGDLMIIESIIRANLFMNTAGKSSSMHPFLHHCWVDEVQALAMQADVSTRRGTYIFATGPNYETKAEIRAFRHMGADAVGMSTAPELFEASRLNFKTAAVSMISNMAAGITRQKLNHEEVKAAADSRQEDFACLMKKLVLDF